MEFATYSEGSSSGVVISPFGYRYYYSVRHEQEVVPSVKISRIRDWLDEAHNLLMLLWLFPSVYFVESYPCLL
jgi:hypothetical protein